MPPLLDVRDLVTEIVDGEGRRKKHAGGRRAVDGVSLTVERGGVVGLVGESGSGKSMTALSILGLLPPAARVAGGQVLFDDQLNNRSIIDLVALDERRLRRLRGSRIAMIFQEPMTSLNPVFTVGDQVGEPLRIHRGLGRRAALDEAVRLLELVGIADPRRRAGEYPHQLSGGMRQRVMIAMALACGPDLLIADEPTTALDVTIQAQILELLSRLRKELGMAMLLITHDLAVVAETCDEVVVMYAGQVVERAAASSLLTAPRHPYTSGLLRAVPRGDGSSHGGRLAEIPGMVPSLDALPAGCRFADRCDRVEARCRSELPALVEIAPGHLARCHFPLAAAEAA